MAVNAMETEDVVANGDIDCSTTSFSHRNRFRKLKASLALKRRIGSSNDSTISMTRSVEGDALANYQEREISCEDPKANEGSNGRKVSIDQSVQSVVTMQDLPRSFEDLTTVDPTNSHPPGKYRIESSTSPPTAQPATAIIHPNTASPTNIHPVLPSDTVWARGDPVGGPSGLSNAMDCPRTLHVPPPRQHQRETIRQLDPALQARIEAVHIQERLLGVHHPDVIFAFSSLEKLFARRGMYVEASQIRMAAQRRSFEAIHTAATGGQMRADAQEPPANIPAEITFQHEKNTSH
mmetsp:Transcript_10929/g.24867  ORF Transcript_10929/g.24867 Transcript_10929/m.24867 type:complete len:293 (-) Transcript_10929:340-1218(-)